MNIVKAVAVAAAMTLFACASATASTNVCGPINADVGWSLAGQPYIITCDVVVMPGATLTIDPGVLVQFKPGKKLRTQGGQISAIGTGSNFIVFASEDGSNPGQGVEITPSGVTGGVFDYCAFIQLNAGISLGCCGGVTPVTVNHSNFQLNSIGITGYTGVPALINNSTFALNTIATDTADKVFEDCQFNSNGSNMTGVERITLRRCSINGGTNGVVGSGNIYNVFVYDTVITGTQLAVYSPTAMERCKITGNNVGLKFNVPPNSLQCNDIFGNTTWNVESASASTVSFANNYWGTTSFTAIDAGIKDGFDQTGLGFVQYTPILTGPYNTGPCNCVQPTVTAASPASVTKFSGKTVSFSVTGGGTGPLSYQWFRNNVPLNNNGRISGADTSTLTINPLYLSGGDSSWTDGGAYTCRVSNLCGSIMSNAGFLTVTNCFADTNQNGTVSVQDLFDFMALWFAGCP